MKEKFIKKMLNQIYLRMPIFLIIKKKLKLLFITYGL